MPFHVEISSPLNRARILNVDEEELRKEILEAWVAGLPFNFGGQDWQPRESRLTILEGPALKPGADGEDGWSNALRAAEDVTRPMLEAAEQSAPARIAVLVEANSVEAALKDLRSGRPQKQIPWATAIERIGNRDPEITALILVVKRPEIAWPEL
jgi:hypothetical protein